MRKTLLVLLAILLITGCNKEDNKEQKLDDKYIQINDEIKTEIGDLENLDIANMKDIDINMLSTEYGLNLNLVENYISGISTTEEYKLYLAIKPKSGKEETIKKAMSNYFQNLEMNLSNSSNDLTAEEQQENFENIKLNLVKNRLETEVNGYYIYIISNSNEEILAILKSKLE